MKIALVSFKGKNKGLTKPDPVPTEITEVFNITSPSPRKGKIQISLTPRATVHVGADIQMKVSLSGAGQEFEELFWAKITEPEKPKEKINKKEEPDLAGLPDLVVVYKDKREGFMSWDEVAEDISDDFNYETVMYPLAKGEAELEKVFINMDSSVLKSFLSKYKNPNEDQLIAAENKYKSSVFLHTLFLYAITKNRGFEIGKRIEGQNQPEPIDIGEYLRDVFDHYYSSFLLNYRMEEIMTGIGD